MYIKIYWKVMAWGLLMLVVFLAPSNRLPEGPTLPFADKIAHVFLFFVFSLLLLLARIRQSTIIIRPRDLVIRVLIIAVIFGALIELTQSLMAIGREGSLFDLIADLAGALFGSFFVFLLKKSPPC